jgi:hypothetical protein
MWIESLHSLPSWKRSCHTDTLSYFDSLFLFIIVISLLNIYLFYSYICLAMSCNYRQANMQSYETMIVLHTIK